MEEWIKKAWKRLKSWWGAIFLFATGHFGQSVWERLGNFDLLKDILGWFGVSTDMMLTFLLSPELSFLMAAVGVFGMVFLEKPDFKTKHPASQLVGVSIFVVFASLIGGSLVFEALLETPKFADVTKFFVEAHTPIQLSATQENALIENCKKDGLSPSAPFYISASVDNNSIRLAQRLYDDFSKCGMTQIEWLDPYAQDPGQQGIMLETINPKSPSQTAKTITSVFINAKIPFTTMQWPDKSSDGPTSPDFVIYVTPNVPVSD